MVVIGELARIIKVEKANLPSASEEIVQLRDGATRKVLLEFKLCNMNPELLPESVNMTATLENCNKDEILFGAMFYERQTFRYNTWTRGLSFNNDTKSQRWNISPDMHNNRSFKVKVFIMIISEKAMDTNEVGEIELQKNSACSLSQDYAALHKNGDMADVTIVCDGARFPAHKLILSARSEVFAAMFSHKDTLESQKKEILIKDTDKHTMDIFLRFVYDATQPQNLSFEALAELLRVADKYQVPSLIHFCVVKLRENICTDNAIQGAIYGSIYRNSDLKRDAIKAIVNAETNLSSMNGYEELRGYPDLLIEMLDYSHGERQLGKSGKRKMNSPTVSEKRSRN